MISSVSNDQIKYINKLREKAKFRKEEGLFVVEGINIFSELMLDKVVDVFVSESFEKKFVNAEENDKQSEKNRKEAGANTDNNQIKQSIKERFDNILALKNGTKAYTVIGDNVFKKVSDTMTPQGILATVKMQSSTLEEVLKQSAKKDTSKIMVLERLQDPGNMGTIIRTSEAAGVDLIIVSGDSVDVYNPKVVRATMGGILRVPIVVSDNLEEVVEILKKEGYGVYAAHLKGETIYEASFTPKRAFLIGNESKGLSDEISYLANYKIKIPMEGEIESLNAAVAAAILMYQK